MKIVQIDGIKGLITAAFIGICLFAGFVAFPGLVCMHLWNKYLAAGYMFPVLSAFQGVLLWGIIAISYSILSKNNLAVSFIETPELSEDELNKIIQSARFGTKLPLMRKVIKRTHKFELPPVKKSDNEQAYISSPINSNVSKPEIEEDEKVSNIK